HPENVVLGVYTFLPWTRTGIAAAVQTPPSGAIRAGVTVKVAVQAPGVADQHVCKPLSVRGPGDVLGFDERHVVRRYPQPGSTTGGHVPGPRGVRQAGLPMAVLAPGAGRRSAAAVDRARRRPDAA